MHAFIRGNDIGFSAERFYGGVADLLAGVEEEEGYVVDGRWVGWKGREESKRVTTEVLTRTEEPASDKASSADTIRRTTSDKERQRMEEILRPTPSPPSPRSSPSSPCPEERVEVQRWRCDPVAAENAGPVPESVQVRRTADSQKHEDANLSTVPPPEPHTQSQARSFPSLPRL